MFVLNNNHNHGDMKNITKKITGVKQDWDVKVNGGLIYLHKKEGRLIGKYFVEKLRRLVCLTFFRNECNMRRRKCNGM
jgi:hypothetical protein